MILILDTRFKGSNHPNNRISILPLKRCMLLFLILFSFSGTFAQRGLDISLKPLAMHLHRIVCADTDASGNLLLTTDRNGSTIIWDSRSLEPLNLFTINAGDSHDCNCDLSSGGNLVAIGEGEIYVFEAASGRLIAQTIEFPYEIKSLKFIGDKFLAVATDSKETVILATETWSVKQKLNHLYGNPVAFDSDASGWLVVACEDGIELYDNEFNLNKTATLPEEMSPASIRFSPDGSRLTIGFSSPHVPLTFVAGEFGTSLQQRYQHEEVNEGAFAFVRYSCDGIQLLAAGNAKLGSLVKETAGESINIPNNYFIGRWHRMGTGEFGVLPAGFSPISSLITLPGGCLAYSDDSPALVRLNATGQEVVRRTPKHNRFKDEQEDLVLVNANADELVIRYDNTGPLRLSLRESSFSTFEEGSGKTKFRTARKHIPGLRITFLRKSDSVFLNDIPVTWFPIGDSIRCADIADHGLRFVLGSDNAIYCAGRDGTLIWKVPVNTPVRYINISGNARVIVAAFDDGSLQWFRMNDGMTLLGFASYNESQYWAFNTGSGFIEYSPGAENVFGISIMERRGRKMTFLPLTLLDNSYFRLGIVANLVQDWDEEKLTAREGITLPDFTDLLQQPVIIQLFPPVVSEMPVVQRFHLIVGSYPQIGPAENRVQQLLKSGYTGAIILESDGRFRVSIQSFDKFEDAAKQRKDLEKQFSGIWVLDGDRKNK